MQINPYKIYVPQVILKKQSSVENFVSSNNGEAKKLAQVYYRPISFGKADGVGMFWDDIKYENAECEYYSPERGTYIAPNNEALKKLEVLKVFSLSEKKKFTELFCRETGFPNLAMVKAKTEHEINSVIHRLSEQEDFDVLFTAYDKNSSLGRGTALPGSDCDALFMIIDPKSHKEPWYPGFIRWRFKDFVNQRLLCTHAAGLPEVLSLKYIEEGLELAEQAFKRAGFNEEDFLKFERNLHDSSNDFVSSAEFNIRLAGFVPRDIEKRTLYYKTAMLAELLRDGEIIENNFSSEFIKRVKESPLYKYSNLMKQRGLDGKFKEKHLKRMQMVRDFGSKSTEEQFELIKDMIYASFLLNNFSHKEYFVNLDINNNDEMGNISEMYAKILNCDYCGDAN